LTPTTTSFGQCRDESVHVSTKTSVDTKVLNSDHPIKMTSPDAYDFSAQRPDAIREPTPIGCKTQALLSNFMNQPPAAQTCTVFRGARVVSAGLKYTPC